MNKFIKLVATVVSFVGLAYAAPGAYVQVQGGVGGMDTKDISTHDSGFTSIHLRDGLAYRVSGGYLFGQSNLTYGLEMGYASYADNTYKTYSYLADRYTGSNVDLLAVAKYHFNPAATGFYVQGKAGAAYVMQENKVNVAGYYSYTDTEKQLKPELAVGAGYDINQHIGVDVSYSHIFADNNTLSTSIASVNTLMAGVSYHF